MTSQRVGKAYHGETSVLCCFRNLGTESRGGLRVELGTLPAPGSRLLFLVLEFAWQVVTVEKASSSPLLTHSLGVLETPHCRISPSLF